MVRAAGRIVVCVDAAADVSTMRTSSRDRKTPIPDPPKTASPSTESTSPVLSPLPRPMPVVPMPANDCADRITMT
ncbi:MAG TPA: hypothetical protein VF223_00665 [Trebonia sp.]